MANKGGTITIKELITDDAINWGSAYQKNVEKAIATNQQFVASVKELVALYPQLKAVKSEGDYVASKEKEAQLIRVTTSTMKEQQKVVQDLVRTKAQLLISENDESRRLADLKVSRQLQNKTIREEAVLNNALVGSYQKLNTQREQAKTKLRDLIASEKASNQEIRKAQAEYDRLHAKVVKADRATSDFTKNVGNYKSALGKGMYAIREFAGAFGLFSAVSIGKSIFEQIITLNSVDMALKNVTETSEKYARSQGFIKDLADESGVEIKKLTDSYVKFYASSKNTNLTLKQQEDIFRAVTKSSALLGLSTDDTEGSLNALSQMLSKGKIQAEELRGQLGDRLPGAFQIMAESMNVTTAELDKMLKEGKVISEEVLPNFAKQLEKTFNADNRDNVETIRASVGRLKNAFAELLVENNKNNEVSNKLTKSISYLADNLDIIFAIIIDVAKAFLAYKVVVISTSLITKAYTGAVTLLRIAKIALAGGISGATKALKAFLATMNLNPFTAILSVIGLLATALYTFSESAYTAAKAQKRLNDALEDGKKIAQETGDAINESLTKQRTAINEKYRDLIAGEKSASNIKKLEEARINETIALYEKEKESIAEKMKSATVNMIATKEESVYTKKMEGYLRELSVVYQDLDDSIRSLNTDKKELNKTNKNENDSNKKAIEREKAHNIEIEKRNKLIEGSLGYFDKLISQLEDESKKLAVGSEEYKKVIVLLEKYKKLKEEITNITQNNGLGPIDESELQGQTPLGIATDAEEKISKLRKAYRDLDKEEQKQYWEDVIQIANDAIGQIANLVNSVFENRINNIQAEMDANEDYYQHQMTLANDDSVQQNLLEEERFRKQEILRKKQLAEKQKQAKYEKAFNIMQTIIETRTAIVKTMSELGLPLALPFMAMAGIMGAVQLATIVATPIPKYKQGTDFHKGGLAIVGDGGVNEIVKEPSRPAYLTPNKDTLLNLERGTKVYKSKDDYLKEFKMSERASILTSLQSQSEKVKELSLSDKFDRNMTNISNEIKKGFKNVKIQNQNNTNINLDYYLWKNKNAQF